ncbi:MAG: hypothetical protein AAF267_21810 [Deinococcota bacterium]
MQQRLPFLGLVLFLAACSNSPRPDVGVSTDSNLLGIVELDSDMVSTQALVPGLTFSVVESTLVEGDGLRVREVVFTIENTSERDLSNLTLYSIDTPNTFAGTNVSNLRDGLGEVIDDLDMALSIIAVHGQDDDDADMQAFTEADRVRVKALLDDAYPDTSFEVLSRGFVVSNISGQGDRAIAMGEQGIVTLALRYPYDSANPAGYPDSFNLSFAFVDEPTTRVTQGEDESNEGFVNRVTSSFSPLPDNLEIIPNDPDDPPQLSTDTTILTSERPNPPITQAPTTDVPTDDLPTSFTLGIASVNATAEVDITVTISSELQSSVAVQE